MNDTASMTAPPVTIVEFLTARLDEDEAAAQGVVDRYAPDEATIYLEAPWPEEAAFLPTVTPARRLAEIAAKRAVVAEYASRDDDADLMLGPDCLRRREWSGLRVAVRHLASVYVDHPDYREEWKS